MAKKGTKNDGPAGPATIQNRKASFDFHIEDTLEVGMVLHGSEAKSLFGSRGNLTDAFCKVVNEELWVLQLDIEPYKFSSAFSPERRRDVKLLAHKKEILLLDRKSREKGYALIALKIYFKNGRAKMLIGLGIGKKNYDKREAILERDTKRERDRGLAGKD